MTEPLVFAIQDALERVDNDVELLKELIAIFFQEFERELVTLRKAGAAHDSVTFSRAAHSLKGAAANVGAMQVARVAAKLERLGDESCDLESYVQNLCAAVDAFRSQQQTQLRTATKKA